LLEIVVPSYALCNCIIEAVNPNRIARETVATYRNSFDLTGENINTTIEMEMEKRYLSTRLRFTNVYIFSLIYWKCLCASIGVSIHHTSVPIIVHRVITLPR